MRAFAPNAVSETSLGAARPVGARAARRSPVRSAIAVGLLVAASCLPSIASAQLVEPPPDLPEPSGASSPAEEVAPEREKGARVRFGLDLGPVWSSTHMHTHNSIWFGGQLDVRFGAQITDLFALYAQVGGVLGVSNVNIIGWGGGWTRTMLLGSAALLAELTFANCFQIALGPSAWMGEELSRSDIHVAGPGLTHRVGLAFGGGGHGTRQGFSVALQLDIVWFPTADAEPMGHHHAISALFGWDTF